MLGTGRGPLVERRAFGPARPTTGQPRGTLQPARRRHPRIDLAPTIGSSWPNCFTACVRSASCSTRPASRWPNTCKCWPAPVLAGSPRRDRRPPRIGPILGAKRAAAARAPARASGLAAAAAFRARHGERLRKQVLDEQLDFALWIDGDGDCCELIDEQGLPVRGERLLTAFAERLSTDAKRRGVVIEADTSPAARARLAKAGIPCHASPASREAMFATLLRRGDGPRRRSVRPDLVQWPLSAMRRPADARRTAAAFERQRPAAFGSDCGPRPHCRIIQQAENIDRPRSRPQLAPSDFRIPTSHFPFRPPPSPPCPGLPTARRLRQLGHPQGVRPGGDDDRPDQPVDRPARFRRARRNPAGRGRGDPRRQQRLRPDPGDAGAAREAAAERSPRNTAMPTGRCSSPAAPAAAWCWRCWPLVNPGDEVIVFDPYFVMYPALVGLVGGKPVLVDTYPDFRIDLDACARPSRRAPR